MAKDILLFGHIWSANALYFFDQLKEALEDDPEADLTLRVNTNGGEPDYMVTVVEKVQELKDQINLKAGMSMHSAGFFMMLALDPNRVECNDLTQSVLHRIAYPEWLERSDSFKGSAFEALVSDSNKKFEKMLRERIDVAELEALPQMKDKNITVKDVFSMEQRIDVVLSSKDLKKLGIVSKVNKVTASKKSEMVALTNAFTNCHSLSEFKMAASTIEKKSNSNSENMDITLESLKTDYPAIYEAAVALGRKEGKEAEAKRVKAWAAWAKIDPARVEKGISEGAEMTIDVISELSASVANAAALQGAAAGNPGAGKGTPAPAAGSGEPEGGKKKEDEEINALSADIDKLIGKKEPVVAK